MTSLGKDVIFFGWATHSSRQAIQAGVNKFLNFFRPLFISLRRACPLREKNNPERNRGQTIFFI